MSTSSPLITPLAPLSPHTPHNSVYSLNLPFNFSHNLSPAQPPYQYDKQSNPNMNSDASSTTSNHAPIQSLFDPNDSSEDDVTYQLNDLRFQHATSDHFPSQQPTNSQNTHGNTAMIPMVSPSLAKRSMSGHYGVPVVDRERDSVDIPPPPPHISTEFVPPPPPSTSCPSKQQQSQLLHYTTSSSVPSPLPPPPPMTTSNAVPMSLLIGSRTASHKPNALFKNSSIIQLQKAVQEDPSIVASLPGVDSAQVSLSHRSLSPPGSQNDSISANHCSPAPTNPNSQQQQPQRVALSKSSKFFGDSMSIHDPNKDDYTTNLSTSSRTSSTHTSTSDFNIIKSNSQMNSSTQSSPDISQPPSLATSLSQSLTQPTTELKLKSFFKQSSMLYAETDATTASTDKSSSLLTDNPSRSSEILTSPPLMISEALTPSSCSSQLSASTLSNTPSNNLVISRHNQPQRKNDQKKLESMLGERSVNRNNDKALKLLAPDDAVDHSFVNAHEDLTDVNLVANPLANIRQHVPNRGTAIFQGSMLQQQLRAGIDAADSSQPTTRSGNSSTVVWSSNTSSGASGSNNEPLSPQEVLEFQKRSRECTICGCCIYWHGQWVKARHFIRSYVPKCIDCGYYHADRSIHGDTRENVHRFNNKHCPPPIPNNIDGMSSNGQSIPLPDFSSTNILCPSCLSQLGTPEIPSTHHGHFIVNFPVLPLPTVQYQPSSVLSSDTILPSRKHFFYHIASSLRPLYVTNHLRHTFKPPSSSFQPTSQNKLPPRVESVIGFSMLSILQAGFQSSGTYLPLLGRIVPPRSEYSSCLHNTNCQRIQYIQPLKPGQTMPGLTTLSEQPSGGVDSTQVASRNLRSRTGGGASALQSLNAANTTGYDESSDATKSTSIQHHLCACMLYTGSYALRHSSINNAPHKAGYCTDPRIRWLSYRDVMYIIQSIFATLFTPLRRISQDLQSEKVFTNGFGRYNRPRANQKGNHTTHVPTINEDQIPDFSNEIPDERDVFEIQRDLHYSSQSYSRNFTQSFKLPISLCLPGASIVSIFAPNSVYSTLLDILCATTGIVTANIHYSSQSTQLCSLLHQNENLSQTEINQLFKHLNTNGWYAAEDRFGTTVANSPVMRQHKLSNPSTTPTLTSLTSHRGSEVTPTALAMQSSFQLEQQRLLAEQRYYIPALPIAGKEISAPTIIKFQLSQPFLSFLSTIREVEANVVATTPTVAAVMISMLKSQYSKHIENKRVTTVQEDALLGEQGRDASLSVSSIRSRSRTESDATLNTIQNDFLEYDLGEHFVYPVDILNGVDLPSLRCVIILHDVPYYHYFGGIHFVSISSLVQHGFSQVNFISNDNDPFKFPLAEHISTLQKFADQVDQCRNDQRFGLENDNLIPPEYQHQSAALARSPFPHISDPTISQALNKIDNKMENSYQTTLYDVPFPTHINDTTVPHFYPSLSHLDQTQSQSTFASKYCPSKDSNTSSQLVTQIQLLSSISHSDTGRLHSSTNATIVPAPPPIESPQDIIFSLAMTGGSTSTQQFAAPQSPITDPVSVLPPSARFAILGQQSFAHSLFNNLTTTLDTSQGLIISGHTAPPPIEILHEPLSHFNGKSTLYHAIVKHGRCCIYSHIQDKDSELVVNKYLRTMTSLTAVGSTSTQSTVVASWASTLSLLVTQKVQFFWLVSHLQPTSISAVPSIWSGLLSMYSSLYKQFFQRVIQKLSTSMQLASMINSSTPYSTPIPASKTPIGTGNRGNNDFSLPLHNSPSGPEHFKPRTPTNSSRSFKDSFSSPQSSTPIPTSTHPAAQLLSTSPAFIAASTAHALIPNNLTAKAYVPPLPLVTHIVATKIVAYLRYRLGLRLRSLSVGSAHVDETLFLFLQTLSNGLGSNYKQALSQHQQIMAANASGDFRSGNNSLHANDSIDHELSFHTSQSLVGLPQPEHRPALDPTAPDIVDYTMDWADMQKNQFVSFVIKGRVPILLQDAATVEYFGIDGGWPLFSFTPLQNQSSSINSINTTLFYPPTLIFDHINSYPILSHPLREIPSASLLDLSLELTSPLPSSSSQSVLNGATPLSGSRTPITGSLSTPIQTASSASEPSSATASPFPLQQQLINMDSAPISNPLLQSTPSILSMANTFLPTLSQLDRIGCYEVYGSTETGMVTINRTVSQKAVHHTFNAALTTQESNNFSPQQASTRMILRSVYFHKTSGTILFHNIDSQGNMIGTQNTVSELFKRHQIVPLHQSSISMAYPLKPPSVSTLRGEIVIRAPGKALGYFGSHSIDHSQIILDAGLPLDILRYCSPHTPFLDNDWYCTLDIGEQSVHIKSKLPSLNSHQSAPTLYISNSINFDISQESPIKILGRIHRVRKSSNGEFTDWSILESMLNQKVLQIDSTSFPQKQSSNFPKSPTNLITSPQSSSRATKQSIFTFDLEAPSSPTNTNSGPNFIFSSPQTPSSSNVQSKLVSTLRMRHASNIIVGDQVISPDHKVGLIKGQRMIMQSIILLPGLDFELPPHTPLIIDLFNKNKHNFPSSLTLETLPQPNCIALLVVDPQALSLITPFLPQQSKLTAAGSGIVAGQNATKGTTVSSTQVTLYYQQHLQSLILHTLGLGIEYVPDVLLITTQQCTIDNYCVSSTGKILRGAVATRFYDSIAVSAHSWIENQLTNLAQHYQAINRPLIPPRSQSMVRERDPSVTIIRGTSMVRGSSLARKPTLELPNMPPPPSASLPLPPSPSSPSSGRDPIVSRSGRGIHRPSDVSPARPLPPPPPLEEPQSSISSIRGSQIQSPADELQLLLHIIFSIANLIGVDVGVIVSNIDFYHQIVHSALITKQRREQELTEKREAPTKILSTADPLNAGYGGRAGRGRAGSPTSRGPTSLLPIIQSDELPARKVDLVATTNSQIDRALFFLIGQNSLLKLPLSSIGVDSFTLQRLISYLYQKYDYLGGTALLQQSILELYDVVNTVQSQRNGVKIMRRLSQLQSDALAQHDSHRPNRPIRPSAPSPNVSQQMLQQLRSIGSSNIDEVGEFTRPSSNLNRLSSLDETSKASTAMSMMSSSSSFGPSLPSSPSNPSLLGKDIPLEHRLSVMKLGGIPPPPAPSLPLPPPPENEEATTTVIAPIIPQRGQSLVRALKRGSSVAPLDSPLPGIAHIMDLAHSSQTSRAGLPSTTFRSRPAPIPKTIFQPMSLTSLVTPPSIGTILEVLSKEMSAFLLQNDTELKSVMSHILSVQSATSYSSKDIKSSHVDQSSSSQQTLRTVSLVTGATGLVGMNLLKQLLFDAQQFHFDRSTGQSIGNDKRVIAAVRVTPTDISNYTSFRKQQQSTKKQYTPLCSSYHASGEEHDCYFYKAAAAAHKLKNSLIDAKLLLPDECVHISSTNKEAGQKETCIRRQRQMYHDMNVISSDNVSNTQQTYPYICNCMFSALIILPLDVSQQWWGLPLGNDHFVGLEEQKSISDNEGLIPSSHQSLVNVKYPQKLAQNLADDVHTLFNATAQYFSQATSIPHSKHTPPSLLSLSLMLSRIYTAAASVNHSLSFTELYHTNVNSLVTTALLAKIGSQFRKLIHSRYTNRLHLEGTSASGTMSFYNPTSTGSFTNSSLFDIRVYHISSTDTIDENSAVGAPLSLDKIFSLKSKRLPNASDDNIVPTRDLGVVLADDPNKKEKQVVLCYLNQQHNCVVNSSALIDPILVTSASPIDLSTNIDPSNEMINPRYVQPEEFMYSGYRQSKLIGERLLVGCCRAWGVPLLVFNAGHITIPWGHSNKPCYQVDPNLTNGFESDDETIPSEYEQPRAASILSTQYGNRQGDDSYYKTGLVNKDSLSEPLNIASSSATLHSHKENPVEKETSTRHGFLSKFLEKHSKDKPKDISSSSTASGSIKNQLNTHNVSSNILPPVTLTPHSQLFTDISDYSTKSNLSFSQQHHQQTASAQFPHDFPHSLLATVALQHTTPPLTNAVHKSKFGGIGAANNSYQAENFTNTVEKFDMRMNLYPVDWLVLAIVQISSRHDDLPAFYQFYQGQSSAASKTPNQSRPTGKDIFDMVSSATQPSEASQASDTDSRLSSTSFIYSPPPPIQNSLHALPVASNPRTGLRAILNDPDRYNDMLAGYLDEPSQVDPKLCVYSNFLTEASLFEHLSLRSLRDSENRIIAAGMDPEALSYKESLWYDFHSPLSTSIVNNIRSNHSRSYRPQPHLTSKLIHSTLALLTKNTLQVLSPDPSNTVTSSASQRLLDNLNSTNSSRSSSFMSTSSLTTAFQSLNRDANLSHWGNNGMRIVLSHYQPISMDAVVRKCIRVSYPHSLPTQLPPHDLHFDLAKASAGQHISQNNQNASHKLILPTHTATPFPLSSIDASPHGLHRDGSFGVDNGLPYSSSGDDLHSLSKSQSTERLGLSGLFGNLSGPITPVQRYQNRGVFSLPNIRRFITPATYANWLFTLSCPIHCYYYDRVTGTQQQLQLPSPLLTSYLSFVSSNSRIGDDLVWTSLSSHLLLYHLGVTPVAGNQQTVLQPYISNIAQRFIQSSFSSHLKRQSNQMRRLSSSVGQQPNP